MKISKEEFMRRLKKKVSNNTTSQIEKTPVDIALEKINTLRNHVEDLKHLESSVKNSSWFSADLRNNINANFLRKVTFDFTNNEGYYREINMQEMTNEIRNDFAALLYKVADWYEENSKIAERKLLEKINEIEVTKNDK